jgi:hypothetical protein
MYRLSSGRGTLLTFYVLPEFKSHSTNTLLAWFVGEVIQVPCRTAHGTTARSLQPAGPR